MVQSVGPDPPFGRFHQQLRIVIAVGEESIKGEPDLGPLLLDLSVAHRDDLLPQGRPHAVTMTARRLSTSFGSLKIVSQNSKTCPESTNSIVSLWVLFRLSTGGRSHVLRSVLSAYDRYCAPCLLTHLAVVRGSRPGLLTRRPIDRDQRPSTAM